MADTPRPMNISDACTEIFRLEGMVRELRAEVERLRVDAERYRAVREFGSQMKLYVYDDENDLDSGGWLYKPSPEKVDQFADEWIAKCAARSAASGATPNTTEGA